MCPKTEHPHQLPMPLIWDPAPSEPSETGSTDSSGPTGELSPSESDADPNAAEHMTHVGANTAMKAAGVSLVRRHQGRATISTGFLTSYHGAPATFIALKEDHGEGAVMVTLSLKLSPDQWRGLERGLTLPGQTGTVALKFDPTTPNEAPPTTVAST